MQGRGTARALLMACLLDMKLVGYGYAIIGSVGPSKFYSRSLDAIEIPDSTPGIWRTMFEIGIGILISNVPTLFPLLHQPY